MGQREIEKRQKVAELVRQLVDETNAMGFTDEVVAGIVDGLVTSHRTLQQNFMRCLLDSMKEYGETNCDLRNEASVQTAKKIGELNVHFPYV